MLLWLESCFLITSWLFWTYWQCLLSLIVTLNMNISILQRCTQYLFSQFHYTLQDYLSFAVSSYKPHCHRLQKNLKVYIVFTFTWMGFLSILGPNTIAPSETIITISDSFKKLSSCPDFKRLVFKKYLCYRKYAFENTKVLSSFAVMDTLKTLHLRSTWWLLMSH